MFYNQKHLQKILEGKQNQYMQNLCEQKEASSYPLETLKRKEWVRQNMEKGGSTGKCSKGVNMIGSGNIFDSSKVETMIARENYFNRQNLPRQSTKEPQTESHQSDSRYEQPENHSEHSRTSGYRESLGQGWPAEPRQAPTELKRPSEHKMRGSMNAKQHNDDLFKKKASQRRSVGYGNMRKGECENNWKNGRAEKDGAEEVCTRITTRLHTKSRFQARR